MTPLVAPPSPQASALSSYRVLAEPGGRSEGADPRPIDDWERLRRFLVLGREDGTYRAGAAGLSLESAHSVFRCLVADGPRVVRTIVEVAQAGRPARPEPGLFVLALAAADRAAGETRAAALAALPQVCRTGVQLLRFARYADDLRGWGRGLRRAVAAWYQQPAEWLTREIVATPAYDGWMHRDLLRLAHPRAPSEAHQELFRWIVRGWSALPSSEPAELRPIYGYERVRRVSNRHEVITVIREYRLSPEAVPANWRNDVEVWSALVEQMSTRELLGNLETMADSGALTGHSEIAMQVAARLGDAGRVRQSGVQPFEVLAAWKSYAAGSAGNSHAGTPVPELVDALETAFQHALGNVSSTGRRWLVALDVSGSTAQGEVDGLPGISPREAALAMALIVLAAERRPNLLAFTAGEGGPGGRWGGVPQLTPLNTQPGMRLAEAIRLAQRLPMGGVDCAYPMQWALREKLPVDIFAVFTDAETWSGKCSPARALQEYRERMGITAKLVVVGMRTEGFRVADAQDAGMLDVVGFDTATPGLIADFAAG